jgi:energy-coupling factor transporter ATP-binding protein EcfA2
VHGFTGHPKETWTLKAGKVKKRRQDDEPAEHAPPAKVPRLQFFSRGSQTSEKGTTHDAENGDEREPHGKQRKDVYWPADLACHTIPDSRILTYAYDTRVRHFLSGPVSQNSVYDHAWDLLCCLHALRSTSGERERPIIFVAHSLGGLVVKEALIGSRGCQSLNARRHLYSVFEAAAGIMFFGTPHRGADPRSIFHHVLQVSAKALGAQVNESIVRTLMPDSDLLPKLRDEFSVVCNEKSWPIFSFQEERGVPSLFGRKVVDDQSSCLDNPTLEIRRHISRNHMDMCRFSGLQDPEYRKVEAALKHILGTIETRSRCASGGPIENSIPDDLRTSLIERLYFAKIDERLTHLTPAQGSTCRWFLDTPQYTLWRDITQQADHGGFLWIKGNPGTGKSTLMKFLFEQAMEETRNDPSQITLSFFFLARGTAEEKSTTGLYRSVLHQLFKGAIDLQDSLECLTLDGARGIHLSGWHQEALKKILRRAVQDLGSRSLTIFVDALDECEDNQARDMVFFFEELCDLAQQKQVQLRMCFFSRQYLEGNGYCRAQIYHLRSPSLIADNAGFLGICFASRHYPHIEIERGIELTLEDEQGHAEDIKKYIKAKLRLSNKKAKLAQSLHAELLERSSLIFLWVVLVVDILNSESPRNPNIDKMRKHLKTIPPKLADLFEMILTRD